MPCKNPKGIAGYAKEFLRFFVVLKGFLLRFHRHNILVGQAQVGSSAYTCRARAAPHIRRPATECPSRRKVKPSRKPAPSAAKTAFVGFSRTYCSLSP